ncbi:MAG: response regulator transcription factor [Gammaproteobacteria bacterium]
MDKRDDVVVVCPAGDDLVRRIALSAAKVRVLVASERPVFRAEIHEALARCAEVTLVGVAPNYAALPAILNSTSPNVMIMDADLPDWRTMEYLRYAHRANPATFTLVVGAFFSENFVTEALLHGTRGFLVKPCSDQGYLKAIEVIRSGDIWMPRASLVRALKVAIEHDDCLSGEWSILTLREREVVTWIAQGMTNKEIARQLGVSEKTVKTHLSHVFSKLKVKRRAHLIRQSHHLSAPPRMQAATHGAVST